MHAVKSDQPDLGLREILMPETRFVVRAEVVVVTFGHHTTQLSDIVSEIGVKIPMLTFEIPVSGTLEKAFLIGFHGAVMIA